MENEFCPIGDRYDVPANKKRLCIDVCWKSFSNCGHYQSREPVEKGILCPENLNLT
jgi:hypothetical protein